jgi:hypothetical protein
MSGDSTITLPVISPNGAGGHRPEFIPVDRDGNVIAAGGGGGGGPSGTVSNAGVNGAVAQAVQGINGGVPLPVAMTNPTALTDAQLRAAAVPVSAASLPLPTGAATQATLANIDTDIGATTDAAAATDGAAASLIALTKRGLGRLSALIAQLPAVLGPQAPAACLATTLPNDVSVGAAASIAALNIDLLTGNAAGWYDAANFHSAAVQIVGGAGISAGAIIFEQTNDNVAAPNGSTMPVQEPAVVASSSLIGAQAIAASTARVFVFPVTCRYVRVRVSTAFVGGNVQAVATFSQLPLSVTALQALNPTAANLNATCSIAAAQTLATVTTVTTLTTCATVTSVTSGNLGIPFSFGDVASAALTTSTTTSAFTPTFGCSYEVNVPVTAVSGTTPTLDIGIEESDDGGTNWFRVYDFPRITATGMYRSPKLPLTGNRVRYVQTVGGTTPSFTRAVNRLQSSDSVAPVRQLIDRTLVPNTLNSVTPSLDVKNCRNAQVVINIGIATTPQATQIEGSDDGGLTWYAMGAPINAVASSTVQLTVANMHTNLLRARVSTAGSGVTAGYVAIKGF